MLQTPYWNWSCKNKLGWKWSEQTKDIENPIKTHPLYLYFVLTYSVTSHRKIGKRYDTENFKISTIAVMASWDPGNVDRLRTVQIEIETSGPSDHQASVKRNNDIYFDKEHCNTARCGLCWLKIRNREGRLQWMCRICLLQLRFDLCICLLGQPKIVHQNSICNPKEKRTKDLVYSERQTINMADAQGGPQNSQDLTVSF